MGGQKSPQLSHPKQKEKVAGRGFKNGRKNLEVDARLEVVRGDVPEQLALIFPRSSEGFKKWL